MANLIFKYAAMNSGKTLNILQTIFSYEEKNMKVTLIKSVHDTKGGDKIVSRNGLDRKVDIHLKENESLLTEDNYKIYYNARIIIIDEAELLSESQIEELWTIAHLIKIPVIAFGLRSNFKGDMFSSGTAKLFALSDEIEEIGSTSLCVCGAKAIFNSRKVDNEFTDEGEVVVIDGSNDNIEYEPLCSDCYLKHLKIKSKIAKKLAELVEKVS